MPTFTAPEEIKKERLDKFLTEKLEITRSQVKKRIELGQVLVNGERTTVHHFLKAGDHIVVLDLEELKDSSLPEIEVLKNTKDYVVINKPAGLLTHPANSAQQEVSVVDWLKTKYPKVTDIGDPERPGIVHRLDKLTSGVMVIAKSQKMFDALKQQFHDREVEKTYLALVHGNLPHKQGEIDKPIGRSTKGTRMATRVKKLFSRDREALTRYEVTQRFQHYDFITAYPLTGRTHQIRVHLHSLGHPVAGDPLYKIHSQKEFTECHRLFLHATTLSFYDLSGKLQTIHSPLPQDLQDILDQLK